MAVHPEAAHALTTEAIQAQVAITAGVALDCDDTITTTYAYDANGNQIGRTRTDSSGTHTDTYVFDYKNRLVQAATRIDGPPAFGALHLRCRRYSQSQERSMRIPVRFSSPTRTGRTPRSSRSGPTTPPTTSSWPTPTATT
jgi:YD repeat-containing protein